MMIFGYHLIEVVWEEADEEFISKLFEKAPITIQLTYYKPGACSCIYTQEKTFWRQKKFDNCFQSCHSKRGASFKLDDVQYTNYSKENHRRFANFKSYILKMGFEMIDTKSLSNSESLKGGDNFKYHRIEIPLQNMPPPYSDGPVANPSYNKMKP